MRSTRMGRRLARRNNSNSNNSFWLSFSDLMSLLLLVIILIMFYIMFQYFDMYETSMSELSDRETALNEARQTLSLQQSQLDESTSQLEEAQAALDAQQEELTSKQTELDEAESTLKAAQEELTTAQEELATAQEELQNAQNTLSAQSEQIAAQQTQLESQAAQIEQLVGVRSSIIHDLSAALSANNISARIDSTDGSITLASEVLFDTGRSELSAEGKALIDQFLPVYLSVLLSDEYVDYISEIIVEGHTDSDGGYIMNLELSQERALAVSSYILSDGFQGVTPEQKEVMRSITTANGRSYSNPVLDSNGNEDKDASRRVVFKFRLTDEQMVMQLQSILDEVNGN